MDPEEEALDWGDGDLDEEFQEQDQDIVSLGGDPEEDQFPDNHPQDSTSELLPILTESQAEVKVEKEERIKEDLDLPLKDQADVDVIPNHPPPPSTSSHSRQASSSSSKDNDDPPLIKARKDLAPGWTTVAVKDSDDFYYYHPISGKTSRIRPREVVKEKIWVNPNPKTVIGKGTETESLLSNQNRYSTRDSPPRISGSGSKRSAANQDGNRSDDRLQIDPSIRSSGGSYISSPSLETNGNFPNKRLRSLNPATESTSPTTQYPGQVYRRESSSNYIGSPTTSSHAKSSEIQDRMGPPSTIARTSDSGQTSRDRDRSSGLDRSGRDGSTSSARIDSRSSRTNDQSGPSGGNSVPVGEAAPPQTSSGAGSLLSRLSAAPVTTPASLEEASPISESKGNDAGFIGLSIRGSAQLSSKSSRSESAATTPVEKKSEVGDGRSDAKDVEKRDKEERSKAYQRKEAFTKSRSRSRSPTATFSSRPPISTQASQTLTSQSIPRSSKDSPVRSRDSPPRDTSNRSESSAPSSLDPNPVGIDRYIPKDPDYRFTTTGKWLMSDEKKRLKALLAKKTIPYRSEEEADDEDDRRRAEFSELRLQEGIAPRGWRERDDQYLEVGGEHGYPPRQVYEKMGNRSDHYSSHYSSRKEERGDSSRSPWKNDDDLKKRQDYEEEMKMRQREDDYYREKRQEEKAERSGGKELLSSSSKIIQSSSKMERSTSSHSAGSIPRPHSPPRSKSRLDSRNQNGREKEKSKEAIRTYSPPRTKSAAHSPVREIKASTSSSTPQPTSTSSNSSSSQVKQGSTPAIHPDRLKALGDTSQPAATSSSTSDVGSSQKTEYYKDNNVGSGALNELGIPTGPRSSAPVFKPTKYQPGDGTYSSRGSYRGRGGFYGRGRGGY